MEKINSSIDISSLIAREMSGQLNPKEKESLDSWLKSSPKNELLYRKIIDSTNFSRRNELYDSVNVRKAWNEVSAHLDINSGKSSLRRICTYAAAIMLPIFIVATAYWYIDIRSVKQFSESTIVPGTPNAVLIMANGSNINLHSGKDEKLLENDGTIIQNKSAELSYPVNTPTVSKEIKLNTLIIPKGGEYRLVLSDGTRIFLNSMSKLVFPIKFTGNMREVTLEGEALFEVTKDSSKPFIVSTKGMKVEVLGTSFNIKSYPDEQQSYTTLVEGEVKLNSGNQLSEINYLTPNQQAVYNPSSETIAIQEVDANQVVQWTQGKYTFTNQTLDEIMKTLSRWYDFTYKYEDEGLKAIRFEGGLNKYEHIDPILDIIYKTGKVEITVKGNEVLFSKI